MLPDLATPLAIDNLPQIVSFESSNEDMNYINKITKIIRRFGCINWWSYWNSKTWNKKTRRPISWSFLAPLAASLVQPVVSSVVKTISGRAVTIARRRYRDKNFLVLLHPFSEIETTNCFNNKPRFNGVFSRNNLPRIKNRTYLINIDNKKVKEHIEFHYLLIEIQLHTLIILDLTIFLRKY